MLSGIGTDTAGTPQDQVALLASDQPQFIAACMSYMRQTPGAQDLVRRSREVFFRGFRDKYRFYVNSGEPFSWRRIVFESKERFEFTSLPANGINGYMRNIQPTGLAAGGGEIDMFDELFSGTRNVDWKDPMTAIIDRYRVKVWEDRKLTMNPRNDTGLERLANRWNAINRRLVYDDDEIGDDLEGEAPGTNSSPWASESPRFLGNVYVVDLFDSMAESAVEIRIRIESKRYWHER